MSKRAATRARIFSAALGLFRRQGFDKTTMRQVAQAAELSLGAAYHHFASKEALVREYYGWMQGAHEERVSAAEAADPSADLGEALARLLHEKLDLLAEDQRLLATLFRDLGDPSSSLSVFSEETRALRERSLDQFRALFSERGELSPELRELLARAAWAAHLGLFLYFIHDRSPEQRRTRRLADALSQGAQAISPWLAHPMARPFGERALELARELELIPTGGGS